MSDETWVVMCQVSGGVTGTRQGMMKKQGEVQYYGSEAEAQAACPASHTGPTGTDFKYWVEQL